MQLPLVEKELTRTGKRRWTYVLRVVPVVIAVASIGLPSLFAVPSTLTIDEFRQTAGIYLSYVSLGFQFFCVFALAPLATAGLIAQEKRDRTLGLLLMADMRGADIAFAKLLSAFTQVEFLLLGTLPLLAIAAYMGGVSVPVVALQILLFTGLALATCSIGLLCSTVTRRPVEALFLAVVIESAWMIVHSVVGDVWHAYAHTNPAGAIVALDQDTMDPASWLPALVFCLVVAAVCCVATVLLLPRQVFERPRRARRRVARRSRLFRELLPASPTSRLIAASAPGLGIFSWPRPVQYLVAVALMIIGVVQCGVSGLLIVAVVCYDITSSLAAAQESGAFDAILVTPIENRRLARSIFGAFFRRSLLFFPALAVRGVYMFPFLVETFDERPGTPEWVVAIALVVFLVLLVLGTAISVVTFVAYGCFGSTLRWKPVGQTAAVVGIYIGVQSVLGILFSVLMMSVAMRGMVFGSTSGPGFSFYMVMFVAAPVIGALVNLLIATRLYRAFAHRIRTRWRMDETAAA